MSTALRMESIYVQYYIMLTRKAPFVTDLHPLWKAISDKHHSKDY